MKKLTCLLLVLMLAFGLAACSQPAPAQTTAPVEEEAVEEKVEEPVEEEAAEEEPAEEEAVEEEAAPAPENPVIRLSTTTSVNDSGLLPYLQPTFEEATGYKLEITSAGTGAAIEKARTGDADALLVHAKASEEEFIGEGYGEERVPFMFNYFVIVGPADDPAGVADCTSASEAFKKIAESGCEFISRGDDSGTHKAELKIWKAAEMEPNAETDKWYISAGAGMGACINQASERQAYVLSDKATYLAHELKDTLTINLEESDELMNTYSMIAVTTDRYADTNYEGAMAFINWMLTEEASKLIAEYGVEEYGEQLFYILEA